MFLNSLGDWLVGPQVHLLKVSKFLRDDGNTLEAATTGNLAQASKAVTEENALEWVKNDKRRMLHVVYRVGDLDKTIKYVYLIQRCCSMNS